MKKFIVSVIIILLAAGGLLLSLAPDNFSLVIIGIMSALIFAGLILSLIPALRYANAFRFGRQSIEQATDVQSAETWIAVFKLESLFHHKELDQVFRQYKTKVEEEKEYDEIESDIEDFVNEDFLSLRTWQGVILQIPGVLTGLGLLGTFIGLITGISSIGFTSVDAALESISVFLVGIRVAFYTSISGVILSIIFNILNRLIWNSLLREYGLFMESFHRTVIPSVEESSRVRLHQELRRIINRLERLPRNNGFSLSVDDGQMGNGNNEQMLMPQVIEGLKNDEFTFFLQPRVLLSNKQIQAAEALTRWVHPSLGTLAPASFIPMLEKNGFITKLDAYIWEQVFMMIRRWIDAGLRPVPITVNISKTDLMAMDVPAFFAQMLVQYKVPPRSVEVEIAKNAYTHSPKSVEDIAGSLRRQGFKVVCDGFDGDYIALNMLEGMELDALKLDLRFMPERDYNNIEAIFEQARKLGVELTVAGIENTEQITYLKRSGCLEGQGYYYYKPMSIDEFENTIR